MSKNKISDFYYYIKDNHLPYTQIELKDKLNEIETSEFRLYNWVSNSIAFLIIIILVAVVNYFISTSYIRIASAIIASGIILLFIIRYQIESIEFKSKMHSIIEDKFSLENLKSDRILKSYEIFCKRFGSKVISLDDFTSIIEMSYFYNKNKVFKESNRFNNELKRISILISKNEDVIFSEQDDITALYTFYLENRDMY